MLKRRISVFIVLLSSSLIANAQFRPDDLPGLQLWLSADTGIVLNGGADSLWADRSGNNNHAVQSTISKQPLFIPSESLLNNNPVLKFDGTDDYLTFNSINNIRTVFWVVREDSNASPNFRPMLGHSSLNNFHRGDNSVAFWGSSTSPFVTGGTTYLNSIPINGTLVNVPKQYFILSCTTTGNVSAENISNDRINFGRVWWGEFAELIIYSVPLSPVEQQQVELYLRNKYAPPVNLGPDLIAANLCPLTLSAKKDWYTNYSWSTGATSDSILVSRSGTYSVTVTDIFGHTSSDTIQVSYPGNMSPFNDSTICYGDTLHWNTGLSHSTYTFLWSNATTDSLLEISSAGIYFVNVTDTNSCMYQSDSIAIAIDNFQQIVSLGPDDSLCNGNYISLTQGSNLAQNYLWSNSSTGTQLQIFATGDYWVAVTDTNGCAGQDTIHVTIVGQAPIANFTFTTTCFGSPVFFTDSSAPADSILSWHWQFGDGDSSFSQNPFHLYADTGAYQVLLTVVENSGCDQTISKTLHVYPSPVADFSFSPNAVVGGTTQFSDLTNTFGYNLATWSWNFDDTASGSFNIDTLQNPVHQFLLSGYHYVKLVVTTQQQCADSTIKSILVNDILPSSFPGLLLWLSSDNGVVYDSVTNKVSEWDDQSGNNNNASQTNLPGQPLFVNTVNLLNSKPVIRFDGIINLMRFNRINTIRDCFFVIKNRTGTQVSPSPVLGDSILYDFHGGADSLLFDGSNASPNLLNGSVNLNTQLVNPISVKRPNKYSILSLFPIGNLTAEYIANDRNISGRTWDGDYAEIIIYNQALSPTQRQEVEQYIHNKYAPPVTLGPDLVMTTLCDTSLDASPRFISYKWHQGNDPAVIDTNQVLAVNRPGKFWIDVTDVFGFSSSDTVTVSYPLHQPLQNNTICSGDSLIWNTNLSPADHVFLWSDNSFNSSLTISQAGLYYVTVSENSTGCIFTSDTIGVNVDSFPLIASLGNDSISLCVGNTIGLVQGASQATDYLWSTSDTTSTIQISVSGNYSLFVQDSIGCSKTDSIYATVIGLPPVANFSSTSVCYGSATLFSDSSYDPTPGNSVVSWHWNFDDATADTVQNPSHIFLTSGNHQAVLTVYSNLGCPDSDTSFVVVHHVPSASFINTLPCTINNVQFTSTSTIASGDTINSWLWNFGNPSSGNNSSSSQNPTHVFDTTGNYVVSLINTSAFGCADTIFHVLNVKRSSSPNFQYSPTCLGDYVHFTNLSTPPLLDTAWRWDFGDFTGINLLENPTHRYAAALTYYVTLTVTASTGCVSSTNPLPVTVSPMPIANFVHSVACVNTPYYFIDSSYIANGSITGWYWNIGGLKIDSSKNTFYTFTDTGSYTIVHSVTSDIGCTNTTTSVIRVNPLPVVNFIFDPPYGNPPLSVTFTNLTNNVNANTYAWSFGDGAGSSLTNPVHLYTDTSLFDIKLVATNVFGCKDSAQKNIYVIKPVLDLAVTGVSSSYISGNYLHIRVNLANLGTQTINNFKIEAQLDGGTPILESYEMILPTGYSGQLELASAFDLGAGQSQYFCVQAVQPNNETDDVASNNEKCRSLSNDFSVPDPYPNPFNDKLVLQMIIPYKGDISIDIFDMLGKQVTLYEAAGHEGLNQYEAELGDLTNGPYTVRFRFKDAEIVKTILKLKKKE